MPFLTRVAGFRERDVRASAQRLRWTKNWAEFTQPCFIDLETSRALLIATLCTKVTVCFYNPHPFPWTSTRRAYHGISSS